MRMTMTVADYKNLIRVVQGDDTIQAEFATTDIIFDIMDNHMNKHLARYYGKATTGGMDNDDIRQVFLIAVSMAIESCDPEVGNPLLYLLQKGKWAVVDELRKRYRQTIRQYCHDCNKEARVYEISKIPVCAICNSENVERVVVDSQDDGEQAKMVIADDLLIDEVITSDNIVEQFRLTLNGKTLEVFEMIYDKGYDRTSCNNYIKEIAIVMGVTPTNINIRLRKIKEAWGKFMQEISEFEGGLVNE